jgi:hypothetical protein
MAGQQQFEIFNQDPLVSGLLFMSLVNDKTRFRYSMSWWRFWNTSLAMLVTACSTLLLWCGQKRKHVGDETRNG